MDMRSLSRPAADLLTRARCPASLPLTTTRGHKTTARTKRALKIAPHDAFLPDRSPSATSTDSIIYNPPASEASPLHTPFLFLPPNDPRRAAIVRMRAANPDAMLASNSKDGQLSPPMSYPRRQARYHLRPEDMEEMRRLRNEDPIKWSVNALARKFECSSIIVRIAAPSPEGHKEWLKEKQERRESRWGPMKTRAREERRRRAEMMYQGEL